jgi:hypothetical protein
MIAPTIRIAHVLGSGTKSQRQKPQPKLERTL